VRLVWRPEDVEHMWNNHKITPDEAEEVFDDPYLLTYSPDYASKSGLSDRYVGECASRGVPVVISYYEIERGGIEYGANAWITTGGKPFREYHERRIALIEAAEKTEEKEE
jgi:hypothetical protein